MIIGLLLLSLIILFVVTGPWFTPDPCQQNLSQVFAEPGTHYLLGADHLGRSVAARMAEGGRNTLYYSLFCVVGSVLAGVILGLTAAWRGCLTDLLIMRLVDITMAFPGIILALLIAGVTGGGPMAVIIALTLTGWPEYCRITRAIATNTISRPYVESGVLAGFSSIFILRKYILAEILPQIAVLAPLGFGRTVLNISALGFLGIGLAPPEPEWGAMIAESLPYLRESPNLVLIPAATLSLTVFSFFLIANPLSRRPGK